MRKVGKFILRLFSFIFVTIGVLLVTFSLMFLIICYGPSESARDIFVTTFLETGQMKFVVKVFVNKKTVDEILNKNSMSVMKTEMDDSLIDTSNKSDEIILEEVTGNTFYAKMLIIKDPSRVKLATTFKNGKWTEYGKNLDEIVKDNDALAGVNGGLYYSYGNKGGQPLGFVVSGGELQYNNPNINGLFLVGFNKDNILKIIDMSGKSASEVEKIVKDENIRDAIAFQDETNGSNSHFVKLIINGEKRDLKGTGSGVHPRTCIGQREDGTVLILVTDGRGKSGHLGASAADLIRIMEQYGAINAANIDGGSSSSMVYEDKYEMTSVTFYYSNSSWKLPTAFIVEKR